MMYRSSGACGVVDSTPFGDGETTDGDSENGFARLESLRAGSSSSSDGSRTIAFGTTVSATTGSSACGSAGFGDGVFSTAGVDASVDGVSDSAGVAGFVCRVNRAFRFSLSFPGTTAGAAAGAGSATSGLLSAGSSVFRFRVNLTFRFRPFVWIADMV